jgi:hypothetical protein
MITKLQLRFIKIRSLILFKLARMIDKIGMRLIKISFFLLNLSSGKPAINSVRKIIDRSESDE